MILKFGTRPDYDEVTYTVSDLKEAYNVMHEVTRTKRLPWNYERGNYAEEENWIEIDFGSHTQFFYLTNLTGDDWNDFFNK